MRVDDSHGFSETPSCEKRLGLQQLHIPAILSNKQRVGFRGFYYFCEI